MLARLLLAGSVRSLLPIDLLKQGWFLGLNGGQRWEIGLHCLDDLDVLALRALVLLPAFLRLKRFLNFCVVGLLLNEALTGETTIVMDLGLGG
jgi:hypothetical protein